MIVDAFSKWPEVIEMNCSTTAKTIEALQHVFAIHGLPEQIVSDVTCPALARTFR